MSNLTEVVGRFVENVERTLPLRGVVDDKGRVTYLLRDMDTLYMLVKGKRYWFYFYRTPAVSAVFTIKPEDQETWMEKWFDICDTVDYYKTEQSLREQLRQF